MSNEIIKVGREHRLCLSDDLNIDVELSKSCISLYFKTYEDGLVFEWSFIKKDFYKFIDFLTRFKQHI